MVSPSEFTYPWRYLRTGERVDASIRFDHRSTSHHKSRISTYLVSFLVRSIFLLIRARYRVRVQGWLPEIGCVAVSIHNTYLDAIFPSALSPRVTPVVSNLVLHSRFRRWFFTNYGAIWSGMEAIPQGVRVVCADYVCWLAPHGFAHSRHGSAYSKARLGAARIALLAQRPVVGISIHVQKTRRARPTLLIRISEPLWPHVDETARHFTTRFMASLDGMHGAHVNQDPKPSDVV